MEEQNLVLMQRMRAAWADLEAARARQQATHAALGAEHARQQAAVERLQAEKKAQEQHCMALEVCDFRALQNGKMKTSLCCKPSHRGMQC